MSNARLLTVVEVDEDNKILCQAPGCGHAVYKRVHVVENAGSLTVLGSDCFRRLHGSLEKAAIRPRYGLSDGRRLTEIERQMLLENTQRFMELLETEWQGQEQGRSATDPTSHSKSEQQGEASRQKTSRQVDAHKVRQPRLSYQEWLANLTVDEQKAFAKVRSQARDMIQQKYGIDPDLPGFVGMVNQEARTRFELQLKRVVA